MRGALRPRGSVGARTAGSARPAVLLPVPAGWGSTVRSQTPGRVRLHVPRMQGDAGLAAVVAARLRRMPGVRCATAHALTGTALVEYDPDATSLTRIRVALRGRRRAARRPVVDIERLPKAV